MERNSTQPTIIDEVKTFVSELTPASNDWPTYGSIIEGVIHGGEAKISDDQILHNLTVECNDAKRELHERTSSIKCVVNKTVERNRQDFISRHHSIAT